MKAAFYTLGCKVNQYETQALSEQFRAKGFQIVPPEEEADVYLVNSCTVTGTGDQKSRQAVRRFKRLHPQSIVVLTGCMPQAYPDQANTLAQADIVTATAIAKKSLTRSMNTSSLASVFFRWLPMKRANPSTAAASPAFRGIRAPLSKFRMAATASVPIASSHFARKSTLKAARRAGGRAYPASGFGLFGDCARGNQSLLLMGRISSRSICDAVERACTVDGILRVRLGSLEPDHLTPEVVARLSKCEKLCPQFHLSLQSGCDATLRRMNGITPARNMKRFAAACRSYSHMPRLRPIS